MKYELLKEEGTNLLRLKALKSFGDVKEGDLGGLVETPENLSQEGNCWVYTHARVCGSARVYDNTKVFGYTWVYGSMHVFDTNLDTKIQGETKSSQTFLPINHNKKNRNCKLPETNPLEKEKKMIANDTKVLYEKMWFYNGTIIEIDGRQLVYVGTSGEGSWKPIEEQIGGRCPYCEVPLRRTTIRKKYFCANKYCPIYSYLTRPIDTTLQRVFWFTLGAGILNFKGEILNEILRLLSI